MSYLSVFDMQVLSAVITNTWEAELSVTKAGTNSQNA